MMLITLLLTLLFSVLKLLWKLFLILAGITCICVSVFAMISMTLSTISGIIVEGYVGYLIISIVVFIVGLGCTYFVVRHP